MNIESDSNNERVLAAASGRIKGGDHERGKLAGRRSKRE
jgi:hypothetical protein